MSGEVMFAYPAPFKRIVPWVVTDALLLVWGFGLLTADLMGGVANACLIAGAGMMLVSLFVGRRIPLAVTPTPTRTHP